MSHYQDRRDSGAPQRPTTEPSQAGRSGEGAASALEQLISQNERQRQQNGQADDAGGRAE